MKITIGYHEYETPFRNNADHSDVYCVYRIYDAQNKLILNVGGMRYYDEAHNAPFKALGDFIADAMNTAAMTKKILPELRKDLTELAEDALALEVAINDLPDSDDQLNLSLKISGMRYALSDVLDIVRGK